MLYNFACASKLHGSTTELDYIKIPKCAFGFGNEAEKEGLGARSIEQISPERDSPGALWSILEPQ